MLWLLNFGGAESHLILYSILVNGSLNVQILAVARTVGQLLSLVLPHCHCIYNIFLSVCSQSCHSFILPSVACLYLLFMLMKGWVFPPSSVKWRPAVVLGYFAVFRTGQGN